jgi:catechol 2,3-dioxygenase-like lactoylglutathione lyase family enzyme
MTRAAVAAQASRAPAVADGALRGQIQVHQHGLNILIGMAADRFDHVFVEPASYDASIAFYRGTLGWRERFAWGGSGQPRGACLASDGGATIVLAERHAATDHSKSHGVNGTRSTLHLRVDDLEARHAELAGVALFAPEATHWGTRWFVARDPDGNLIAFEQRDD